MINIKKELKGSLTEDNLKTLKKEVAEALSRNRYTLVCDFPFTGAIAMRLDLKPVRDKRCRTACTDGKNIYFDCDFYSKLNDGERLFVLSHEIWHCVMLHLSRRQSREHELFNIATDMEVNNLLVEHTVNNQMKPPKKLCFPPPNLKGKSAEVIYDFLLKQAQKNDGKLPDSCFGSSDGKGDNKSSDGTPDNGLSGQFDKHTYTDDNGDEDVKQEVKDQWGEVGYDSDFTPSVSADVADKIREAVIAAAQQYEREHGELPAGIAGIIDKIQKPEIPWNEVLAQFVTSCYNGKRRWLPPNRRHIYNETYFQSRRNETVNIAVAIDTSGSCIGDLPKFFGELKGLIDSFGSYTIHLIQCDAAIASYEIYDDNNPLEIDVASEINYAGGGGTSFCPVFKFVRTQGITVDCLIYLTDAYGDAPENPPNYPVLWLLTKDGNTDFCDWGKKIKFKNSSYDYTFEL